MQGVLSTHGVVQGEVVVVQGVEHVLAHGAATEVVAHGAATEVVAQGEVQGEVQVLQPHDGRTAT